MGKNTVTSKQSYSQLAPKSTLREQPIGKKNGSLNVKSMLKIDHLKSLSNWASSEVCIPSLGAFFGQRLAATGEALGLPPDPSLFPCQRCESLLQPGYSCTVRVVKIKAKVKRKHRLSTKNSVIYKCHFCSHENRKRGTPKGYMKELCPLKPKLPSKSKLPKYAPVEFLESEVEVISKDDPVSNMGELPSSAIIINDQAVIFPMMSNDDPMSNGGAYPSSAITNNDQAVTSPLTSKDDPFSKKDERPSSAISSIDQAVSCTDLVKDDPMSKKDEHPLTAITSNGQAAVGCPATPTTKITTLLDSGKKKRNRSKSKKATESESSSVAIDPGKSGTASRKRRRKSWTSLKEIAERNEQNYSRNLANLTIPFHL